ncbi:MAG: 23S rRNA (pseudouridine(1915)-N(3))-methyltransferase RlmH [Rikenella sp.]|nr:23S rRNA (pseudouridine(1915)-N(3))-methyltransferase RlmH [Rikenella sp.]
MVIEQIVVGKTVGTWLESGIREYVGRLGHYVRFVQTVIPELKNARNLREEQIKTAEGASILDRIAPGDRVVLLDENGRLPAGSVALAEWLQGVMNRGTRKLVFVIGGAYGFSDAVYARADERLSLSPLTYSHQMVRLIFAEQLYRAFTILGGEPYHHR